MLKIDIQICFTTIPPRMQNFIEIHQRNPELLSSGGFRPPTLDRGIERPRLDRVKQKSTVENIKPKAWHMWFKQLNTAKYDSGDHFEKEVDFFVKHLETFSGKLVELLDDKLPKKTY